MKVKQDRRGIKGVGFHRGERVNKRNQPRPPAFTWEETAAMIEEGVKYFWKKPHRERPQEGDFRFADKK